MKHYPFPEKPVFRILFTAFLLGLLMLSRDSMYGLTVFGFYPSHMIMAVMAAAVGGAFLIVQRRNFSEILRDPRLPALGVIALLFLLPMVLKQDWQMMYVSIVFYLCIVVLISFLADSRQVSRYYLTILSVLAVYSVLTTYILRAFADRGLMSIPEFPNNFGAMFYQFGLSVVSQDYVTMRNFGIFREPGVYQFFLLLGLYLNNYTAQWRKNWVLWTINGILAVTMLTTFATGGLIETGLLLLFLFWDKKWYKNKKILAAVGIAAAAVAAAVIWILTAKGLFYVELVGAFEKLFMEVPQEESRIYAIQQDLRLFFSHPILGAGLYDVLHVTANNTTSTMVQYAAFGFLTASFHVAAWAALVWDRKRNVFMNLFLLLILFMSFNTQNLIGNPMFWLFPVLAFLERIVPAAAARLGKKGEK